jgi:hypothetical protein
MAKNMKCKNDGRAVGNIKRYRVQSPMFEVALPENNIWCLPANTTGQLVSDGVFLIVAPLPPGQHTNEFTGTLPDFDFTLHLTYYLTVL